MKFLGGVLVVLAVLVVFFAQTPEVWAQSNAATLSGTIVDPTGAVVPDVKISLVNANTNARRQASTNKNGYFVVPELVPGAYTLQAIRDGFAAVKIDGIVLNTADRRDLQINLKVGSSSETVNVEASAVGSVDLDTSVKTVVDQRFVQNMPLRGRSFTSLIAMTPGVVQTGNASFSINGIRDNNNYFTIDGVAANTGIGNSSTGLGAAGAGQVINTTAGNNLTQSLIAADSMEEFKIQSSGTNAEFGRTSGGQIQLTTRSGSNTFHGTAFDYLVNEAFNAIDAYTKFFNGIQIPPQPNVKPAVRQNNFGGTFSGPVRIPGLYNGKDKTFFFYSYEGLRLLNPTSSYWAVPSTADRHNSALFYPGLQPYIDLMAVANGVDTSSSHYPTFFATYPQKSGHDANAIKLDQKISDKLTVFGRYSDTPSDSFNRGGLGSGGNPNQMIQSVYGSKAFTLGTTWLVSNTLSNEFRGNWSRTDGSSRYWMDDFGGAGKPTDAMLAQMFPAAYGATPENSFFFMQINQSAKWGPNLSHDPNGQPLTPFTMRINYGTLVTNTQRQINLVDNLSWIHGKHSFKYGVDWRYLFPIAHPYNSNMTQQILGGSSGYGYSKSWTPHLTNGVADGTNLPSDTAVATAMAANSLVTGKAVSLLDLTKYGLGIVATPMSSVSSMDTLVIHVHNLSLYAQDSFRVTPRLTLDYGVRWDYNPAPSGASGSLYALNPVDLTNLAAARLAPAGTPLYTAKKDAFAPRIGAAYQLWSTPGRETVLRGSYGLFYDSGAANGMDLTGMFPHQRTVNWPYDQAWMTAPAPLLPAPNTTALPYGGSVAGFAPNYTYPKTHEWNFSVQQGLGGKQSLTMSYVGSAGRNLIRQAVFYGGAKLPQGTVYVYAPVDTSDYNALQVSFVRQMSHGLQVMSNYTFSKSLDTNSSDFSESQIVNGQVMPGSRGPSTFDRNHVFNASIDYDIPTLPVQWKPARLLTSHWSFDAIGGYQTGVPLTVLIVNNLAGNYANGSQYTRPDIVPGVPLWIQDPMSFGGWSLNPAAFASPGSTFVGNGNEPRGYVRGNGLKRFDLTVRREFKMTERLKLQWRMDAFNVLNMTNLGNPNMQLGSQALSTSGNSSGFTPNNSGSSTFGRITSTGGTGSGTVTGTGNARSIQFALKLMF